MSGKQLTSILYGHLGDEVFGNSRPMTHRKSKLCDLQRNICVIVLAFGGCIGANVADSWMKSRPPLAWVREPIFDRVKGYLSQPVHRDTNDQDFWPLKRASATRNDLIRDWCV